jgi:hypothetical protein
MEKDRDFVVTRYAREENERVRALREGNAAGYYRGCNECGIPRDKAESPELYDVGEVEASPVAARAGSALEKKAELKSELKVEFNWTEFEIAIHDYKTMYGEIKLSASREIDIKRNILKRCGYRYLKSRDGLENIDNVEPRRIIAVFASQYERWLIKKPANR